MHRSGILHFIFIALFVSCTAKKDAVVIPHSSQVLLDKSIEREDDFDGQRAKNVIFVVADGMGLTQLSTLNFYDDRPSAFESFKNIGLQKNTSSSDKVTDSAAAATTFATGHKTYNGAIGVDTLKKPLYTIAERARDNGLKTAIIATSTITHATPASFYAHQEYRKMQEEIAEDLWNSEMDFFAGGGAKYFDNRTDSASGIDSLMARGYDVSFKTGQDVEHQLKSQGSSKRIYLLAQDGMPKMQEGRGNFLTDKTMEGLRFIENDPDGFFMLVEASQIDWGGHANDHQYIVEETKDLNTVLIELVKWVKADGNTLLVVTADHETGGYALSAKREGIRHDTRFLEPTFTTSYHTATMIPVFAMGPGSENFRGIYENTKIHSKMDQVLFGASEGSK